MSPVREGLESAPQRIRKMHFLVHPGYLCDIGEYRNLLQKYEARFAKLPKNELVVIFSHLPKVHLRNPDPDNRWRDERIPLESIKRIRDLLGKQAIVLSDDCSPLRPDGAIQEIRRIAKARGFMFNESTLTAAYGEILDACVLSAADHLNASGAFKNPTVIHASLTDFDSTRKEGFSMKDLREFATYLRNNYPRIKLKTR